ASRPKSSTTTPCAPASHPEASEHPCAYRVAVSVVGSYQDRVANGYRWNEESFVPLPAYSSPFSTAGEDSTCFPVAKVHSGGHEGWPHPAAAKAFTVPSVDPAHTSPSATAGDDSTAPARD